MLFQREHKIFMKKRLNKMKWIRDIHVKESEKRLYGKKERICSPGRMVSGSAPTNGGMIFLSGKVSPCVSFLRWKRGSLTLETALVLPLFLLGMVTLISFMDIYRIQTVHLAALCDRVKQAGMYAYGTGGEGPEEITLPDIYAYEPLGGLVPLSRVWFHNSVKVHAWTGKAYEAAPEDEEPAEEMVYVTDTGSVYHKSTACSYLNLSVNSVSGSAVSGLRNEEGERYSACEICSAGQPPAGVVYVTGNGNRYHNLESCSGLKRTVRLVKRSSVENLAACSRCG